MSVLLAAQSRSVPVNSDVEAHMRFAEKIVLHCPNGIPVGLTELAAQFVADGVRFVASVGPACREMEDLIDNASVAAGSPDRNFILTSSHPGEDLSDVVEFAEELGGEYEGPVQIVEVGE